MLKSYKIMLSALVVLATNMSLVAQSETEYKDVTLDGKPAKLNVVTGEIILVNNFVKKVKESIDIKTDSIVKVESVSVYNSTDFHIVKEGETLLDLSRIYKVSLTDLKRANNLETTLIDKNQKLRVRNFDRQSIAAVQKETVRTDTSTSNFHIVEKGDTLFSMAKIYDLSLNELKSKNSLNTDLIKIGQKLRVRDFGVSNTMDDISVWTVRKGDTLFSIAKWSGTTIKIIKELNKLVGNSIMIGQILILK